MNVLKLLVYDIKYGVLKRWYIFLVVMFFAIAETRTCHGIIESLNEYGNMHSSGTVMDYLLYSFQGMPVYSFNPRSFFTIPLFWFVFQIGASYIVAYYTENDFRKNGRNLLLASQSRVNWWISKAITCICSVVIYYLLAVILISILAVFYGATFSLNSSKEFCVDVFSYTLLYLNSKDLVFIVLLLPLIITVSICICQVSCSLIVSPVLCFACVSVVYVLSAYYTSPWLLGNYTMWQRSSYYIEEGLSPNGGILMAIVLICLSVICGSYIISDKDII